MNKRILIAIFGVILLAGAVYLVFEAITGNKQVACTMEAKLCPDGSAVGRTGPNCEFAKCPDIIATGTIKGKVTVGPICPVERPGVPCPVPPEAYTSREIILYAVNKTTIVKRMHFTADGIYNFEVLAGTYVLDIPRPAIGGSSDLPKTLTVKSGETIEFNFSIDTGIR
jgi:hypothetical protein